MIMYRQQHAFKKGKKEKETREKKKGKRKKNTKLLESDEPYFVI